MRGGLYISEISGPACRNHFAASFITSSTRMFLFSGSSLNNFSSATNSGMQSSMILPVSTSRMILRRTLDS